MHGHRAPRLGRPLLGRRFAGALAALVFGMTIGVALGTHEPARIAQKAPSRAEPAQPPEPTAGASTAKAAIPTSAASLPDLPNGLAEPRPLPAPQAAPQPAPVELAAVPAAAPPVPAWPARRPFPGAIASHEDPNIIYEEAAEEDEPTASPAAAARPNRPALREAEDERRPVLIGALAYLAQRPWDGPKPAWLQNALAMPDLRGRPMIAVVIDDVGVDRKRAERAMRLPGTITLSFLPYALEVGRQVQQARALGHEIMVHVPMEPQDPLIDPGPNALRANDSSDEILRRLNWDLSQFGGYVAANNHMGSKFTRDANGMRTVLAALKARGLFFLDSRTTGATVGPRIARTLALPHLERDVFLDNVDRPEEIAARLADLERAALHYGYAIAIGHPRDATLDALEKWVTEAGERGFALVPISAVMRVRLAAEPDRPRLQQIGG